MVNPSLSLGWQIGMVSVLNCVSVFTAMSDPLNIEYLLNVARDREIYTRTKLTTQLTEFLDDAETSEQDIQAITPVLLVLAADQSGIVRRTLLSGVRHLENVPIDVLFALAADEDDIAADILKHSPALRDHELIAVIRICDNLRRTAIAARGKLQPKVCRALIDFGSADVVRELLENPSAKIDAAGYEAVMTRHADAHDLENLLIKRRDLPPLLAIGLVDAVSDRLQALASSKKWLRPDKAAQVIFDAKEEGVIKIIARTDISENRAVVRGLMVQSKLTPSLVLRASCIGKMDFVEEALALLAKMPHAMVHNMVFSRGAVGLKAIYYKAGLPGAMFAAVRVAVDVYRELNQDMDVSDEGRFGRRMIERILTQYEEFSDDDKKYLLSMLRRYAGMETRPLVDQVLSDLAQAA